MKYESWLVTNKKIIKLQKSVGKWKFLNTTFYLAKRRWNSLWTDEGRMYDAFQKFEMQDYTNAYEAIYGAAKIGMQYYTNACEAIYGAAPQRKQLRCSLLIIKLNQPHTTSIMWQFEFFRPT